MLPQDFSVGPTLHLIRQVRARIDAVRRRRDDLDRQNERVNGECCLVQEALDLAKSDVATERRSATSLQERLSEKEKMMYAAQSAAEEAKIREESKRKEAADARREFFEKAELHLGHFEDVFDRFLSLNLPDQRQRVIRELEDEAARTEAQTKEAEEALQTKKKVMEELANITLEELLQKLSEKKARMEQTGDARLFQVAHEVSGILGSRG